MRALAKKGVLNEERFFELLSAQNNYVDTKTMKDFYMGLVRVMTQEIRKNGIVRLPHIGDFALLKSEDHLGWAGKVQRIISGSYLLKFYANHAWRKYFKKLEEKTGFEGKLDPREKIMNKDI